MNPAQQFVHGDDLNADLKKLDKLYLQFPKETLVKGFYSFAAVPPDDSSCLTTRLWDAYRPAWRKDSKNVSDVPDEIKKALVGLMNKCRQATPASRGRIVDTDELAFCAVVATDQACQRRLLSDPEGRCS